MVLPPEYYIGIFDEWKMDRHGLRNGGIGPPLIACRPPGRLPFPAESLHSKNWGFRYMNFRIQSLTKKLRPLLR